MMTCDAPHPGAVLRRCMADQISVTDVAEHLGVPRMTLTRLLTGKIRMSAGMALKLSEAFPPNRRATMDEPADSVRAEQRDAGAPEADRTLGRVE